MLKKVRCGLIILMMFSIASIGQKQITLEDIYVNQTFRTKSVPGFNFMNDGKHYATLQGGVIKKNDFTTGLWVSDLFDSKLFKGQSGYTGTISNYTFSEDVSKILIESNSESIYRHSSRVNCHIYDVVSRKLDEVFAQGKIINPMLSPDGEKLAFVFENNLYSKNLKTNKTTQITKDGTKNKIINGMSDWVYEEEFSFTRAFYWSPDSKKIAFIRFDETQVPQFTMQMYKDEMYPTDETFKYPKVGEKNAIVSVWIYDLISSKSTKSDIGNMVEMYIPRVKWTIDPDKVCVFKLNRHQNDLILYLVDAKTSKSSVLMQEKNKYFVDIHDDLTFLSGNKGFVWTSEKDGFNQLFLYDMKGQQVSKLTKGSYDVTKFYGIDEKNNHIYFQAAEKSPMEKHVFEADLNGENVKNITPFSGSNDAQFSKTFNYFSNTNSNINTSPTYTVYDRIGNKIRTIEENKGYSKIQEDYGVSSVEFFTFTTPENVQLNGYMIKPKDFKPNRKYPVFMTQYSGPNSQQVTDAWKSTNYWWNQMIAQNGYIVVCVDGRGTGARGEEFRKMTYLKMGHYETIDQIETAKYLGRLPYVDASRIGIFGWSYGGFMSSLCILKGNDVFKAAIAVAPVTSWKWYDSVYTERFMRTVAENEAGYRENSPVYFADRLKGNFLLVHGMSDDNVHFQHTVELANQLIKANKQFDTYFYPNRNHGIRGDNATIHLYTKMTNFIYEKL